MPIAKGIRNAKPKKNATRGTAKAKRPQLKIGAPKRRRITRKLLTGVRDAKSTIHRLRYCLLTIDGDLQVAYVNEWIKIRYSSRRSVAVRLMYTRGKRHNVILVDVFPPEMETKFVLHRPWKGWDECLFSLATMPEDVSRLARKLAAASKFENDESLRTHAAFRIEFADDETMEVARMILHLVMLADVRGD